MRVKKRARFGILALRRYIYLAALIFLAAVLWNIKNKSFWNGSSRITIIIQNLSNQDKNGSASLAVFSLEPSQKRALLITIPDNTLLEVPYGYKTYPAASVYRLGSLDANRSGGYLLAKTIEETLGIAVDKYLVYDQNTIEIPQTRDKLQLLKSRITSIPSLISFLSNRIFARGFPDSNIFIFDMFKIWRAALALRTDQITLINLEDSFTTSEISLADGSRARKIDADLFDYSVRENLTDTRIRSENISLEVVNATSTEKVAGQISRVLTHLGAHVLVKSTADNQQKESCLVSSFLPAKTRITLFDFLTGHYNCKINYSEKVQAKTDVKIVLGEEFLK